MKRNFVLDFLSSSLVQIVGWRCASRTSRYLVDCRWWWAHDWFILPSFVLVLDRWKLFERNQQRRRGRRKRRRSRSNSNSSKVRESRSDFVFFFDARYANVVLRYTSEILPLFGCLAFYDRVINLHKICPLIFDDLCIQNASMLRVDWGSR